MCNTGYGKTGRGDAEPHIARAEATYSGEAFAIG